MIPLGFQIESDFNQATSKNKVHLKRASELYPNDKNLISGRETGKILKFTAQNNRIKNIPYTIDIRVINI